MTQLSTSLVSLGSINQLNATVDYAGRACGLVIAGARPSAALVPSHSAHRQPVADRCRATARAPARRRSCHDGCQQQRAVYLCRPRLDRPRRLVHCSQRQSGVYLSLTADAVSNVVQCFASSACPLATEAGTCTNRLEVGRICDAIPVTSLATLLYHQGCTVVNGDLVLQALPVTVTHANLLDSLGGIVSIRGALVVRSCPCIVTLAFLANLTTLDGIVLDANTNLVDATLPALASNTGPAITSSCLRLCPQRYPNTTAGISTTSCASIDLVYFVLVAGPASVSELQSLPGIVAAVYEDAFNETVVAAATVIETGPRWINVRVLLVDVAPSVVFALDRFGAALSLAPRLPLSADQNAFLAENAVTPFRQAYFRASQDGYNIGASSITGSHCPALQPH